MYFVKSEPFSVLLGDKWSPYSAVDGVTEYVGGTQTMKTDLRKSAAKIVSVFRLPMADLCHRQQKMLNQLQSSKFASLGLALAVGKNFCSSSHTGKNKQVILTWNINSIILSADQDMSFSFSGSFSSCGKEGNCFLFPRFKAKIDFPDDCNRLNLFAFNPKFEVKCILFFK